MTGTYAKELTGLRGLAPDYADRSSRNGAFLAREQRFAFDVSTEISLRKEQIRVIRPLSA